MTNMIVTNCSDPEKVIKNVHKPIHSKELSVGLIYIDNALHQIPYLVRISVIHYLHVLLSSSMQK